MLASYHSMGYQPLMREALKRFAEAELKLVLRDLLATQKKPVAPNQPDTPKKKVA